MKIHGEAEVGLQLTSVAVVVVVSKNEGFLEGP
jgi:hypothetical protein